MNEERFLAEARAYAAEHNMKLIYAVDCVYRRMDRNDRNRALWYAVRQRVQRGDA